MLKTPSFWYKNLGVKAILLSPIGMFYGWAVHLRRSCMKSYHARVPIVSIGNIVMGGAGKTPATMEIVTLLKKRGYSPAVVMRGYGGSFKGPIRVSSEKHSFKDVGDEALLLCQVVPTFVAKKRDQGVKMAEEMGADIILLDDGHQNCSVKKDISFVVVNERQKFGNGMIFPAGPLRESLNTGMARADGIIYLGKEHFNYAELPIFRAKIQSRTFPYAGQKIVAFCGLGFPQKFKDSLLHMGCQLEEFIEFPDHHPYSEKDLEEITKLSDGLPIVTTAKDYVRVPQSYNHAMHVMEIDLTFDKPKDITDCIVRGAL